MASSFFGIFHGLNIFEQKDHSCSDQIDLNYGYLNENRSFLLIKNFFKFEEIYFGCDRDHFDPRKFETVFIRPQTKLILDGSFKLEKIFDPLPQKIYGIFFANIDGIELENFSNSETDLKWVHLNFEFTKLEVFFNKIIINECSAKKLKNLKSPFQPFFGLNFNKVNCI